MSPISDQWAAGSTYEHFMGRWSRQLAQKFVPWLQVPHGLHWLEIGCGTGALTSAICAIADPASLVACDPAESFIEFARAHGDDERVTFVVAGADDFPMREGGYHSITSLLALNFFPDPQSALARMRVAARGGIISACVWDYAGEMEFLRRFWMAAATITPTAQRYDEGRRFPICNPASLSALFSAAGIEGIRCEPIDIETSFESFADYWQPMLGGTGPAPSFLASLGADERERVRATLEHSLPTAPNGSISLRARAWAISGICHKPSA